MQPKWLLSLVLLMVAAKTGHTHMNENQSGPRKCPPQESISKCSCYAAKGGPEISCNRLKSDAELRDSISSLKGYSIRKLTISQFNASTWDTKLFDGLHIEDLTLEKLEVEDASFRKGRRHFQGLEKSLRTLEITTSFRNRDRSLLNLQLDHLSDLDTIILEDNIIPEVDNDWFASVPENLTTLVFEMNGIERLGYRVFSALTNVKLLAVAGNDIDSITREMLPGATNRLATLDLSFNSFWDLPSDIFSDMPYLRKINLGSNLLHTLKYEIWFSIWPQLSVLELYANPLQCDEDIGWICEATIPNIEGLCLTPSSKRGLSVEQFCNS